MIFLSLKFTVFLLIFILNEKAIFYDNLGVQGVMAYFIGDLKQQSMKMIV